MSDRDDSLGDSKDFRGDAIAWLAFALLAFTAPIAGVAIWLLFF